MKLVAKSMGFRTLWIGVILFSVVTIVCAASAGSLDLVCDGNSKKTADGYVVRVPKRPQMTNTTAGVTLSPDCKEIAGKQIRFSAEMRYTDIGSDATGNHVGGKILVAFNNGGATRYVTTPALVGTSKEWKTYSLNVEVPVDVKTFSVAYGIQQAYGTLEVRNPRMDFVTIGLHDDASKTAIPVSEIALGWNGKLKDDILTVTVPKRVPMPNQTPGATITLNLDKMRDSLIMVSGKIRYDVASDTTGYHIGGKILAVCVDANTNGKPSWFGSEPLVGKSGEWKEINAIIPVYPTTESVNLVFGMQQAWGTVEFKDLSMEIIAPLDGTPSYTVPENFKCEYSPEVLAAAPRRGFMSPVPFNITADDIREMAKWNVNLIRYQMVDGIAHAPENVEAYTAWLNKCLAKLDSLMPVLKENDIKVIIDMHQTVGGRYSQGSRPPQNDAARQVVKLSGKGAHRLLCEADMRQAYIDAWKMIATRYKDNPTIFGYDLINEPTVIGPTPFHWADVQYDVAKEIRKIDPETPIMFEGNRAASAVYFNVRPIPLKNIFYEIHMYHPGDYCFQGVNDKAYVAEYPKRAVRYTMDRESLRASMGRVIDFQKKYGAKIYVGEFTATRWVPDGGGKYLDDLISLFEEYHWDWTFHAFREWNGFSPEHYGPPNDPKLGDNPRKATLLKYFKRNLK